MIYDCFSYLDEDLLLNLRLHILDKYVDYFVIIEGNKTWQNNPKELKFDINKYEKFKHKIIYIVVKDLPDGEDPYLRENYQRNSILKGLQNSKDDDLIIISDLDEIPNLSRIDLNNVNDTIYAFKQINTMYKFNLIRDTNWIGSKLCKLKKLKSPQWLRSLKVHKKYSYLRIDKFFSKNYVHNFKIIEHGGWHFGWIRDISQIIDKIESFAHTEFNNDNYKNFKFINECINKRVNFLDINEKLNKIEISHLPMYLIKNIEKYKNFIK